MRANCIRNPRFAYRWGRPSRLTWPRPLIYISLHLIPPAIRLPEKGYKLPRFLNRLRVSLSGRAQYRALAGHIKVPMIDDTIVLSPQMEEWRVVIARRYLTEQSSHPDWLPIINHLAANLVIRPR